MDGLLRPHGARLWRGDELRLNGQTYTVEILPDGAGNISYLRLYELYHRLLRLDAARDEYLDVYQLQVFDPAEPEVGFWWVPTRTLEEGLG